ncbi:replication-associated recombination protein A [Ureaplasma urealyticum]|uniref:replication-associated recombination protein A n=1 Tax=Ureaplasma urealyticum TaxID=2130 RepID=UPI000169D74F|nr:replication-associated recombination protein A [Ureaplasma urealyticum]EDX53302.1 ATPase, AAA family [Ureaplasma urealyticum serovar 12 str. ATCC 33696]EDY74583.1 ATPase, AAA family [Ureaplasma urealyticum serovar 4 str. ATCC 27816]MDU3864930.1 replication-associated recombination protein A [Ureaplasma urealyticum]QDI63556.1 AAA family ATPase [Ureaplasma urealyticum]UIU15238.1 replication-associated recombination protein A [Ureaplasma urealyticum]
MLDKLIKTLKNPHSIDDIVGQKDLLDEIGIIRKMVNHHQVFNLIFYGPPGVGKSSLAKVLAQDLKVPFAFFNPVVNSKKQLMQIIEQALDLNNFIIIIDEIHRLNKDKQDILLPIIEANKIKLFATTTENPFFVINPALRSRCQLLSLKPLTSSQISERIKTLINVEEVFEPQAFNLLITKTNGDLRAVINTLEIIHLLYKEHKVDYVLLKRIMQESYALGVSDGDEIHDLKSAFHKSMRGSDCDAALYYLARLIIIGDFEAIYRRISVCVHEDIGLANPNLCLRVDQGINSCRFLGYPENQVILANLVLQICLSNKSNSVYLAYHKAFEDAANGKQYSIPNHIRDAHYASAVKLGVHGYKYPHDFKNNYVNQQYLPRELANKKYYVPQNNEQEFKLNQNQQKFKNNN